MSGGSPSPCTPSPPPHARDLSALGCGLRPHSFIQCSDLLYICTCHAPQVGTAQVTRVPVRRVCTEGSASLVTSVLRGHTNRRPAHLASTVRHPVSTRPPPTAPKVREDIDSGQQQFSGNRDVH